MATRAIKKLDFATIATYTVESGQTATAGKPVKFGTSDTTVQDSGADSDLMIGVALGTPGDSYAAGDSLQVAHPWPIVPMTVGTGGSTRGKKQKVVADGVTDAPTNGGGSTSVSSIGIAMQTGVAGDVIGVMLAPVARVTT